MLLDRVEDLFELRACALTADFLTMLFAHTTDRSLDLVSSVTFMKPWGLPDQLLCAVFSPEGVQEMCAVIRGWCRVYSVLSFYRQVENDGEVRAPYENHVRMNAYGLPRSQYRSVLTVPQQCLFYVVADSKIERASSQSRLY